jgi:hypothetical protein
MFFYFFSSFFSLWLYIGQAEGIALYTDKKENKFFLICEENQNGAVEKSYMTNSLLIHTYIHT